MKKTKINTLIKFALVLWVGLALYSCDDDSKAPFLEPDTRLVGKEGASFSHINPKTGAVYTEEERALLKYNPSEEEYYLPEHTIDLTINVEAKPAKIEVGIAGDTAIITTFDTFTESNGMYSATWSTNITDLGIAEGGNVRYVFYVTYDDLGAGGRQYASQNKFTFKIHHSAEGAASAITFFTESLGSKKILDYEDRGLLPNVDPERGAFLEFNGTSQYITISEDKQNLDFTHTDDFSVSFWVNTTSTTSDPSIIGDKNWGGGSSKGFVIAYLGGNWKVNVGDGTKRADVNGNAIGDGMWHHIAVTFDRDGMMTLYEDGNKAAEKDMSAVGDMNSELPINIAQDGTGSYGQWFQGKVGGVTITKYLLSEGEIAAQAGGNTGVHLRQDNDLTVVSVNDNGVTPAKEKGMIVREFDEPSFAIITDKDKALDFRYTDDFSLAFWVNTTREPASDPSMLGDKNWGGGGNKGFVFAYLTGNWKLNVGDGTKRADVTCDQAINDGEWHLLTATFDRDGDMVIYQDGKQVGSVSMSAIGDMNGAMPIHIAQDGTGAYGANFSGKIGHIYFFKKVLAPEDVEKLFNE